MLDFLSLLIVVLENATRLSVQFRKGNNLIWAPSGCLNAKVKKTPGEELTVRYYQNNESGNHFNTISSYQVLKNSLNELFLRDLYILYDSSKPVITIDTCTTF